MCLLDNPLLLLPDSEMISGALGGTQVLYAPDSNSGKSKQKILNNTTFNIIIVHMFLLSLNTHSYSDWSGVYCYHWTLILMGTRLCMWLCAITEHLFSQKHVCVVIEYLYSLNQSGVYMTCMCFTGQLFSQYLWKLLVYICVLHMQFT